MLRIFPVAGKRVEIRVESDLGKIDPLDRTVQNGGDQRFYGISPVEVGVFS